MNMEITLNKDRIEESGLTIQETLLLIGISNNARPDYQSLLDKGYISPTYKTIHTSERDSVVRDFYYITDKGKLVLNTVILDSDKVVGDPKIIKRLTDLTPKLQELFPTGKKDGTNLYWRGNKPDIRRKLQSFFKKYEQYTDEQIIEATKSYVSSFNGDYRFMKVLQYFIWKEVVKSGTKESVSDLASFIENRGQVTEDNDWTANLL